MKFRYDPKADAMYIDLVPSKKATRTEELKEDILVDYHGKEMVGIEILDASTKLPKKSLLKTKIDRSQVVLHKINK